jgi:hypothetical protein
MRERRAQYHAERRIAGKALGIGTSVDTGGHDHDQIQARHDVEALPAISVGADPIDVPVAERFPPQPPQVAVGLVAPVDRRGIRTPFRG